MINVLILGSICVWIFFYLIHFTFHALEFMIQSMIVRFLFTSIFSEQNQVAEASNVSCSVQQRTILFGTAKSPTNFSLFLLSQKAFDRTNALVYIAQTTAVCMTRLFSGWNFCCFCGPCGVSLYVCQRINFAFRWGCKNIKDFLHQLWRAIFSPTLYNTKLFPFGKINFCTICLNTSPCPCAYCDSFFGVFEYGIRLMISLWITYASKSAWVRL